MLLLFILTEVPDEDEPGVKAWRDDPPVIDPASEDGGRRFSSGFGTGWGGDMFIVVMA